MTGLTPEVSPERLALLLGLGFFFGLTFEELYAGAGEERPGGVRTFPLLGLLGAGLYLVEPRGALAFSAGLLVLGSWLYGHYRSRLERDGPEHANAGLMIPVCNLLAYMLGPISLLLPAWVGAALTVTAVLLLTARERLHGFARKLPSGELVTAAKFLILTGIILPLLPDRPVTSLTGITPHQVWLAVVVVVGLSYGSYLLQTYGPGRRGVLFGALLGGLYSSTATTVVLARRLREDTVDGAELRTGIVLATALMYLRLELVVLVFNRPLGAALAAPLLALFLLGLALAGLCYWPDRGQPAGTAEVAAVNPLELQTGLTFAALFVAVSLASNYVAREFGSTGVYGLAAIVGVTDIDPFVLSLSQGGVHGMAAGGMAAAVIIAASSNNLLKAAYAAGFSGRKAGLRPVLSLLALSAAGIGVAVWLGT